MNKSKYCLIILVIALCNVALANKAKRSLDHNGVVHSYNIYLPKSYSFKDKIPLLVMLHGGGSNGSNISALTGFNSRADKDEFIVVYPESSDGSWFYQNLEDGKASSNTTFILALVKKLASEYKLDLSRIYIAGISNGGYMAQRVACERPKMFAAVASVAAGAFIGIESICKPQKESLPIIFFHGTSDDILPWSGNSGRPNQTPSLVDGFEFWSRYNKCSGNASKQKIVKKSVLNKTEVTVNTIETCNQNAQVKFYSIENGGHNWPGVPDIIPNYIAGLVNTDIHASDEIWKFFKQFHK